MSTDPYAAVSHGRSPRRRRSPFALLGLGCGGILLLGLVLSVLAAIVGGGKDDKPVAGAASSASSASDRVARGAKGVGGRSAGVAPRTKPAGAAKPAPKSDPPATPAHVTALAERYGSFAPIARSGSTDAVIPLPADARGGIVRATYRGAGNFIVTGLDAGNQQTLEIGLPNEIGAYSGTTMFGGTSLGNRPVKLKVMASGPWSITISPVGSAPVLPEKGTSGRGDAVFVYTGGAETFSVSHQGSSNFIVSQVEELMGAQVNEIGNYSGEVPFVAGPVPLTVQADGSWRITR